MKRMKKMLCLMLAVLLAFTGIPVSEGYVKSVEAAEASNAQHTLRISGESSGFIISCTASTPGGLGRTFAEEWFQDTSQDVFYRITTANCSASEASNGRMNSKILVLQSEYKPDTSSGYLKNGVFTPYIHYWNPKKTENLKVWKMTRGADGVYQATDANCIPFTVEVYYPVDIEIEGVSAGTGRVVVDGQEEYANRSTFYATNGKSYNVSAKNIPGYKVKSISHTKIEGSGGQTIKLVYEATEVCTYDIKNTSYGNIMVDGSSRNFEGAVGAEATITVYANNYNSSKVSVNYIEGIYVNGKELSNATFSNDRTYATAKYTPSASGTHEVSVKYRIKELIPNTEKVYVCENPRSNATGVELYEALFADSLAALPESDRPQITENDVTYFAGQRYKTNWDPMRGVYKTYSQCYLRFSDDLPKDRGAGLLGEGEEGFTKGGHLFAQAAGATGTTTEQISINIPATGELPAKKVSINVKVTKYGLTLNNSVTIGKGESAYDSMVAKIDAKFRGNSSELITYTDEVGRHIDAEYLQNVSDNEEIKVIVTYPGDETYGMQKKTVSVKVLPKLDVRTTGKTVEATYSSLKTVSVSTVNGEIFSWDERGESNTTQTVLYYDENGELLERAPMDAGSYTARLQVSDEYGTEISEGAAVITIHPADASAYISAIPVKTYGDEDFELPLQVLWGNIENITYASDNEDVAVIDENGKVSITGVGKAQLSATLPASDNYNETTVKNMLHVDKADVEISVEMIKELVYGEETKVNASVLSGEAGEITYTSSNGAVAEIDQETGAVIAKGEGEAVITVSYTGTEFYKAGNASTTVKVIPAQATVTVQAEDKVYDKDAANVSYETENGTGRVIKEYKRSNEDDSAYTTTVPTDAGEYTVRVTVQKTPQYYEASGTDTFEIKPAEIHVYNIVLENDGYIHSKTYDGTNQVKIEAVEAVGMAVTYVYTDGKYQWIYDDVSIDMTNVTAAVESADAGIYDQVVLSGLALQGENIANYFIEDTQVFTYPASRYFSVDEKYLPYVVENQTITVDDVFMDEDGYVQFGSYIVDGQTKTIDELIDQTKYTIQKEELLDGHYIENEKLSVTGNMIDITFDIVDAEGNDVSDNYSSFGHQGMIDIVIDCDDHGFDEQGFCANCANYEPAQGESDEWGVVTYDIYNAGQLFWFAKQVNDGIDTTASGRLMADINLNPGYTFHSDGTVSHEGEKVTSGWRAWTPIGDKNIYSGSFDGQGHLIEGVYIVREEDKAGLFGWIDYNPTVKDLHLTNSYIKGKNHVGAIGGYFYANMESCTVDTTVTVVGESRVGGFAGYAGGGKINNCASAATVICTGEDAEVAGLVAQNSNQISNSFCITGKLVLSNNESYGGSLTNCFYLDESGETDEYEGTTAVTAKQFASGEIAYLLQKGQTGELEWNDELQEYVEAGAPAQIWGQNIDMEGFTVYDPIPVLHGPAVNYGYQDCQAEEKVYTNKEVNEEMGVHTYNDIWEKDEEGHWKKCACGETTEKETHRYEEGSCVKCKQPDPEIEVTPGPSEDVTEVFDDVYSDWYADYVQYVYDNGLMTGIKGTNNFEPNSNITKAQVAQVLYNMVQQPSVDGEKIFEDLKDVYDAEWYADAVNWAYTNGIVTGDLNTKQFHPNADVTREQLALMIYRYAKYRNYDTTQTSDFAGMVGAEKISNWAEEGMRWAVGAGLISGVDKNGVKDLAPQGNATRAQMAAILQRFCENVK